MSKLASQSIEIFRAGDHGTHGVFTPADLDQIVANYQPETGHEAPIAVGHRAKPGDPAFGWIASVRRDGMSLFAQPKQVDPTFESMVEAGRFKKKSVGLVKDPAKGWTLHHLAFLGAEAPQIKGLADARFGENDAPPVVIEFNEDVMTPEQNQTIADSVIARIGAFFTGKSVADPASAVVVPKTFSEQDIQRVVDAAIATALKPVETKFSERDRQIATAETEARATAAITGLKAQGKYVPAFDVAGLPLVFAALATQTEVIEFGEGAAKKSVTPLQAMVAFMEQLPVIVPNAPVYTGQQATVAVASGRVNQTSRTPVDPNSSHLSQLAFQRSSAEKIDFGEALAIEAILHPELTVPGGATAGVV